MTVVAYVPPIKKWILVHENPVGDNSTYGVNYPVFYRIADNPLDFRLSEGIPIVIKDGGHAPNASPYVVWSPVGGPNGTIVVSDADNPQIYTNQVGGDRDHWKRHDVPAGATYSRAIGILDGKPDHLIIFTGDTFDERFHRPFMATVVNLTALVTDGNATATKAAKTSAPKLW